MLPTPVPLLSSHAWLRETAKTSRHQPSRTRAEEAHATKTWGHLLSWARLGKLGQTWTNFERAWAKRRRVTPGHKLHQTLAVRAALGLFFERALPTPCGKSTRSEMLAPCSGRTRNRSKCSDTKISAEFCWGDPG